MDLQINNNNEVRQGPAFRALVRGLHETSRKCFLLVVFSYHYLLY